MAFIKKRVGFSLVLLASIAASIPLLMHAKKTLVQKTNTASQSAHAIKKADSTNKNLIRIDPLDRLNSVAKQLGRLLHEDKTKRRVPAQEQISSATITIKKIVQPEEKIFIKGDLHGDNKAIPTMISYLQKQDLMDQNLAIKDHVFLVFLGDYIDRGPNSIDVIRQITQLKKINPEKVFLLRGNHEEKRFLFQKSPHALINQIKRIPSIYRENRLIWGEKMYEISQSLLYAFSQMPEMLFIGTKQGKKNKTNYLLLLHGGIPVKPLKEYYNGNKILFNRDKNLYTECNKNIKKFLKNPTETINIFHIDMSINISSNREFISPFTWNDFATPSLENDKKNIAQKSNRGIGIWELNKKETKEWLKTISSDKTPVKGIIRGHQQSQRILFENTEHLGLASRWDDLVLTLDYAPRVPGFKAKYDTWLLVEPKHDGSFNKTIINFDPNNGKEIKDINQKEL